MAASIRFDQVGIAASSGPGARTDGVATGGRVTVRNDSGRPCRIELIGIPPDDTSVIGSIGQDSSDQYHFDPTAARYGSYLIRLIEGEGTLDQTIDEKVFGIRLPNSGLLIPAFNEKGDPLVTFADSIERKDKASTITHNNEAGPGGFKWLGWFKSLRELFIAVENGGGGGALPDATRAGDVLALNEDDGLQPAWTSPDEALRLSSLQANIHVDADAGDDANTGLTQETALQTLGEARRRIGDKNGDVTIWLWGTAGVTSYAIETFGDQLDRLWHHPRKGYGTLTIRSAVVEVVATLTVTNAIDGVYEVSDTVTSEQYDGCFVARGDFDPMENNDDAIVLSSGDGYIWTAMSGHATPDPATITIWKPGITLSVFSPGTFHCGSGLGNASGSDLLSLINLNFEPYAVGAGSLNLQWVWVSGTQVWTDVLFLGARGVNFWGSPYFYGCGTHGGGGAEAMEHTVFATPEFLRCGAAGVGTTFAVSLPFRINKSRFYVVDVFESYMELNDVVCTGQILAEVVNSRINMRAFPMGYRGNIMLEGSLLELEIAELPAAVVAASPLSGLTWMYVGMGSTLDVSFEATTPDEAPWGFFMQQGSKLLSPTHDISEYVKFPDTDLGEIVVPWVTGSSFVNGVYLGWGA